MSWWGSLRMVFRFCCIFTLYGSGGFPVMFDNNNFVCLFPPFSFIIIILL